MGPVRVPRLFLTKLNFLSPKAWAPQIRRCILQPALLESPNLKISKPSSELPAFDQRLWFKDVRDAQLSILFGSHRPVKIHEEGVFWSVLTAGQPPRCYSTGQSHYDHGLRFLDRDAVHRVDALQRGSLCRKNTVHRAPHKASAANCSTSMACEMFALLCLSATVWSNNKTLKYHGCVASEPDSDPGQKMAFISGL